MKSVGTLRACSRCLQGRPTAGPASILSRSSPRSAQSPRHAAIDGQFRYLHHSSQTRSEGSMHSTTLLAAYDSSDKDIHASLARITDTASLIDLLPAIDAHIREVEPSAAALIIATVLRKMADYNALALVPEIMRLFKSVVVEEQSGPDGPLHTADMLNATYLPIFRALGLFHRQSTFQDQKRRRQRLHPIIHNHILLLVRDLDHQIARLPGPSNPFFANRAVISKDILETLFSRRCLNTELMGFLMRYCKYKRIKRGSKVWWKCLMVALEEGNEKAASHFVAEAEKAAKKESKTRAEGIDDSRITTGSSNSRSFRMQNGTSSEDGEHRTNAAIGSQDSRTAGDFEEVRADKRDRDSESTGSLGARSTEFENEDSKQLSKKDIADLIRFRGVNLGIKSRRLLETIKELEPRLHATRDGTTDHVWSHLLNAAQRDKTVSSDLLLELYQSVSESSLSGHTSTPVMLGHMARKDVVRAWDVWQNMVARQEHDHNPAKNDRYVDRVSLAVGTYICHRLHGLEAAIGLVDAWARRPILYAPAANSVILDTHNVNILLHLCKLDKRPSVAFRLFAAAKTRWGVYTDGISMTLLLDTARYSSDETDNQDIRSRLRQLADELRLRHRTGRAVRDGGSHNLYDAYDDDGFSKGPLSVLLDPPGYTWGSENREPPWLQAKNTFEDFLFSNWPWLSTTVSPLDYTHGPYAHKLRDFTSFFLTRQNQGDSANDPTSSLRLPTPDNARYTHLVPSASTFHSYISLLGYYHMPQEIPRALTWMKELEIKPKKQTMITALMYIEDVQGPRRLFSDWDDGASRLLGDGDVLRRWLKDWLGRGVPSEEEVAAFVREYMRRHQGITV